MKKMTKRLRNMLVAVLIILLCAGTVGCMPKIEADESFRVQANAITQTIMLTPTQATTITTA